jgi:hypothetical protein
MEPGFRGLMLCVLTLSTSSRSQLYLRALLKVSPLEDEFFEVIPVRVIQENFRLRIS